MIDAWEYCMCTTVLIIKISDPCVEITPCAPTTAMMVRSALYKFSVFSFQKMSHPHLSFAATRQEMILL